VENEAEKPSVSEAPERHISEAPERHISEAPERHIQEKAKKQRMIKYALIAFTIVATFLFIGIFLVFAASVKNMN